MIVCVKKCMWCGSTKSFPAGTRNAAAVAGCRFAGACWPCGGALTSHYGNFYEADSKAELRRYERLNLDLTKVLPPLFGDGNSDCRFSETKQNDK